MKNNLILTVGLPYSRKLAWAKTQNRWPVVCPDSIRLAATGQRYQQETEDLIWAIAKIFVRSLFFAGHETVIFVACNNTKKRRDFWIDKLWKRTYIVLDISAECCIARAQKAEDQEIVPIIERMAEAQEFEDMYYGDGYNTFYPGDPALKSEPLPVLDPEPMAEYIQRPDGLKDFQIFHNGYSLDT